MLSWLPLHLPLVSDYHHLHMSSCAPPSAKIVCLPKQSTSGYPLSDHPAAAPSGSSGGPYRATSQRVIRTPSNSTRITFSSSSNSLHQNALGNSDRQPGQSTIESKITQEEKEEDQISLTEAQGLGNLRVRWIRCPWQGELGCDAELASYDHLTKVCISV